VLLLGPPGIKTRFSRIDQNASREAFPLIYLFFWNGFILVTNSFQYFFSCLVFDCVVKVIRIKNTVHSHLFFFYACFCAQGEDYVVVSGNQGKHIDTSYLFFFCACCVLSARAGFRRCVWGDYAKKKNLIQVCGGRLHLGTWKRKIRYAAVDSISAHSAADDNLSGLCCLLWLFV